MGRVLRAYDPKLGREVALKELHRRQLGPEGAERIRGEALAMAKLSHANVVALFDVVESQTGRVALVMEYVPGPTLAVWLAAGPRRWQDIIQHFRSAGHGLVAAHAVGLLHRDFKPSNVLVCGAGVAKVSDFGVARICGNSTDADSHQDASLGVAQPRGDPELCTLTATAGTPRYMAPEQHRGHPLGAAADQYALCGSLWGALCGSPPFVGEDLAANKARGPGPWPGTAVPARLANAITRGLAADPKDRWPSLGALLEALRYESRTSRRTMAAGVGIIAIIALGVGAGAALVHSPSTPPCSGAMAQLQGVWGDEPRRAVQRAFTNLGKPYVEPLWQQTEATLDTYVAGWAQMHTAACQASTIRGEESPAVMDLRISCLQRAKTDLTAVVGVLAEVDEYTVQRSHEVTDGLRPVSRCADIGALRAEVEPPLPADAPVVAEIRESLAQSKALTDAGRYEDALARAKIGEDRLGAVDYPPVQSEVQLALGEALLRLGRFDQAMVKLRAAIRGAAAQRQDDIMFTATTALLYWMGGKLFRGGEALQFRPLAEGLAAGNPSRQASLGVAIGSTLRSQGNYAASTLVLRQALAIQKRENPDPDDTHLVALQTALANTLHKLGEYDEAFAYREHALKLTERRLGLRHPRVADALTSLGGGLLAQQRYDEAEVYHQRALDIRLESLGANNITLADGYGNLAADHVGQGRFADAEHGFRRALALLVEGLGPKHPDIAVLMNNMGLSLMKQEKYDESEAAYRRALAIRVETLGPEHPDVARTHHNLAWILHNQNKFEKADAEHRFALAGKQAAFGPDHPMIADSYTGLAANFMKWGRPEQALAPAQRAWARLQEPDIRPSKRAYAGFLLASVLWATSDGEAARPRALRLAKLAHDTYAGAGDRYADEAADVLAWWRERTDSKEVAGRRAARR